MHTWLVLAHVLGAFIFVAAHGVSMFTSFRLRGALDASAIAELLTISGTSLKLMYAGLLILLVAGIAAGFTGNYWGQGWIWASIAILVVMMIAMYAIASPFYGRMRAAAGLPGHADRAARSGTSVTSADLAELQTSTRPYWLAVVGGIGLAAIIYLMIVKPF